MILVSSAHLISVSEDWEEDLVDYNQLNIQNTMLTNSEVLCGAV
jgi:hypothetical protein